MAAGPAGRARLLPVDEARTTRPVAPLVPLGLVPGGHHQLGRLLVPQGLGGAPQIARLCTADPATNRPARDPDLLHGPPKTERTPRCSALEGRGHGRHELEHDHAPGRKSRP